MLLTTNASMTIVDDKAFAWQLLEYASMPGVETPRRRMPSNGGKMLDQSRDIGPLINDLAAAADWTTEMGLTRSMLSLLQYGTPGSYGRGEPETVPPCSSFNVSRDLSCPSDQRQVEESGWV